MVGILCHCTCIITIRTDVLRSDDGNICCGCPSFTLYSASQQKDGDHMLRSYYTTVQQNPNIGFCPLY
jgi:hypothetical protein